MQNIRFRLISAFAFGILSMLLLPEISLHAHGGKQHGSVEFTHLEAVKKATDLFEKLITSKKIDPEWELKLEKVQVFDRKKSGQTEIGVSFARTDDPKVLYIFFNSKGDYTGSNFTGD